MIGRGRIRVLPAALVGLLLLAEASRADDIVNFSFYPKGAQDCLYKAATSSKCESSTVAATNSCFCRNGGTFVTTAAACIGKASPSDLETVYSKMSGACKDSQTPLTISKEDFLEAAASGTSTTTTRKSTTTTSQTSTATSAGSTTTTGTSTATTTTSSPSPTNGGDNDNDNNTNKGISTAALAGIVVGGVVGLALVAVLAYFLFRRGRRVGEESHPMLPQHAQYASPHHPDRHSAVTSMTGGRESTAYYGSPPLAAGGGEAWGKKDYGASPDPRASGFTWESPSHLGYAGAAAAGALSPPLPAPPPVVIQELDGAPQHFPTGSPAAPAEMGGVTAAEMGGVTPVVATAPLPVVGTPPPVPVPAQGGGGVQQYQAYTPGQQQVGGYQQQQQGQYPGQPLYPGQQQQPQPQQYQGGGGAAGWGQGGR